MVSFHYADAKLNFSNKTRLKKFIPTIFKTEKTKLFRLQYIFCSDEYLLQINQSALQHDYYTDIITFNLTEKDSKLGIVGEIYISIDRILENAVTYKKSFEEEALRVIFHGALHLCGYKDKTKTDVFLMRLKEDQYIAAYQNES
jgi:probable rRNA maturation factor